MWRGQLEGLGGEARVVALDVPGFGRSPARPAAKQTMAEMADAALELADGLGFASFFLGGMSMGGYVAFAAAWRFRARLEGLILVDTRAEADGPELQASRHVDADRILHEGIGFYLDRQIDKLVSSPDHRAEVEAMIRATSPHGAAAALRGMADRSDARHDLAGLAGLPVLVIGGAEDVITPPDGMRALAAAIPDAKLAIVPGGHMAALEHPAETNRAIAEFIHRR